MKEKKTGSNRRLIMMKHLSSFESCKVKSTGEMRMMACSAQDTACVAVDHFAMQPANQKKEDPSVNQTSGTVVVLSAALFRLNLHWGKALITRSLRLI